MLTKKEEQELLELLEIEEKNKIRKSHLKYIDYCWQKNKETDPFIVGFHTRAICKEIDQAFENFRNGISTNIMISVHQRSGKSDIVSRYLSPHFLGEFPDQEVMQVSRSASLAERFSAFGRNILKSPNYCELYPNVKLSAETNKKSEWLIADNLGVNTFGKLYASGLHSGLTGNGFALGILDDYCSGREEAESLVQRDNAWEAFTNDFMTRVAPVYIIIILATVWHWDDISGRIKEEMKKKPNFPRFKFISFPAKAKDYKGPGKYPGKYLFLERFSEKWYTEQYAVLGQYSASALLDCNPQHRLGGQLSTNGIVFHDIKEFPGVLRVKWVRVWDLAHTEKQIKKDDPDWTSGTLLAFQNRPGDPIPHLWIKHVARIREGAVKRDAFIKKIISMDGNFVKQAVENSTESKDAYEYLRAAMPTYVFRKISIRGGDKTVRAQPLEPIFEAKGHVHVCRGDWNNDWFDEISKFSGTGAEHDDQVDNLSAGYILLKKISLSTPEKERRELAERRKNR
ncbi:MAG: terminase family protein [Ignavibacteria bacterium]|jgi:phage terminase large subunit-like protein